MSTFVKNIAITFSSRFLAAVFAGLSTIVVARAFGPVGKGIFTMVAFFPSLALNFGHLGLGNANTYLIAQDKRKTQNAFYNSFWYGLILGWFFIVVFSLVYRFSPSILLGKGDMGSWAFYLSLSVIPFILWESFYQGIFVGRQEFKFFNLISLFSKVLLLLGLIGLVFLWKVNLNNLKIAIIYYVVLMAFPAIVYTIYFVSRYGFPFKFDKMIFGQAINFGIRSYIACLLSFLVLRSDIYLINYFRGLKEVGLYSLAVGFGDGILLLASSIALVLFPKITENREKSLEMTLKVTRMTSFILGIILFMSFILARWFIPMVFGTKFEASLPAFYILLPAIYFWSINNFLTQFFASKGYPWFAVWIWLPGLLLNIILNIIFIPKYGIVAAAWTSLWAYLLTFILHFICIKFYRRVRLSQIFVPHKLEVRELIEKLKGLSLIKD